MTNTPVADLVAVSECIEMVDELYDSVLARKARQELASLTPASAEPVDDTSLQLRINEIGNQIHNIACEYQDDDELSERLGELQGRLWSIASEMAHSAPVTVEAALLQRAVDLIRGDLVGGEWKKACNEFVRDALRALTIDQDAQGPLDKMLSQAREDAIREAAHLIECDGDALGGKSGAAKAILALLNDGGRDE